MEKKYNFVESFLNNKLVTANCFKPKPSILSGLGLKQFLKFTYFFTNIFYFM